MYRQEIHLNIKFIKRINKILKGGSKWSFSQRAKQENLAARCRHHPALCRGIRMEAHFPGAEYACTVSSRVLSVLSSGGCNFTSSQLRLVQCKASLELEGLFHGW